MPKIKQTAELKSVLSFQRMASPSELMPISPTFYQEAHSVRGTVQDYRC